MILPACAKFQTLSDLDHISVAGKLQSSIWRQELLNTALINRNNLPAYFETMEMYRGRIVIMFRATLAQVLVHIRQASLHQSVSFSTTNVFVLISSENKENTYIFALMLEISLD